jgi:hypothetical protein
MTMPEPTESAEPTDHVEPTESVEPIAPVDPTGEVFVEADDGPPMPAEAPARRGALRTATVISGRVVLGFVAVGAIAVLVGAAILVPLPRVHSSAVSTVVTPVPTTRQLVCPGGLLRLASASGKGATTVSAIGAGRVVSAVDSGTELVSPFARTDAGTAGGSAAPQLLSTPPIAAGAVPPLLAGAQSESVHTDEFTGLASAECTAPSGGTWLSGGATSVGRTTLLLLANPTTVPAIVSVRIFGENGQISAPGMDGISVGAGAQQVVSLAGFAPNIQSPVVHVQSTGGQIVANLEQTTVRGITPGGIDFVAGTAAPALTTVLPGVVVSGTTATQSLQGQSGYDDLQTTLRFYLPGSKAATASVTVLAENGTVTGKPINADLQPGSVTDLPLDQLSDGNYTVIITSPVPVLASARVSTAVDVATPAGPSATGSTTTDTTDTTGTTGTTGSTGTSSSTTATAGATDFAWITPAALLTSSVLIPVASGMAATVHVENPTSKPETLTLHALSGASITKTIGAHRALSIPVVAGRTYRIAGFSELYASVSGVGAAQVTSYGISPLARGEGPVRVFG